MGTRFSELALSLQIVLWLYGAARLACQQPARLVGCPGGWLAREAPALGLLWCDLPALAEPESILAVMAEALQQPQPMTPVTTYGQQVLGGGFVGWLLDRLDGSDGASR